MSLVSPQFLLLLGLLSCLSWLAGSGLRKWLLLLSSLACVACFNLASLGAIIFFTGLNFVIALQLPGQNSKLVFRCAIVLNCLAILANNYLVSVQGHIRFVPGETDFRVEDLLLVTGLSFYSLLHMAYLADIQLRRIVPEKNFLSFLWAAAYFPKFISGPVTTYQQMAAQLPLPRPAAGLLWQGFNRLSLGFFKKMVLADRLAPSVSSVFDYQDALPGLTIFMAAVAFTIQLYFDFSGYCDIAIGASKLLGIKLPENFDVPLRATSVTVFWRRWHQSLIGFFTNYIFYPVAFRFRHLKKSAAAVAIVITFFVSACWHGLGLTFLAWGICHMAYLLLELYLQRQISARQESKNLLMKGACAVLVLVLVSFSHLFFRATTTGQAAHLFSGLFNSGNFFPASWQVQLVAPLAVGGHQLEHFNLLATLCLSAGFLLFERRIIRLANSDSFKPFFTSCVLLLIFMFGVFGSTQRFIYMQF